MHPEYKQAHWTVLGFHEAHWIHTAYSCFLKPYDFYCNNNLEHFPAQEKDYLSKMPEIQRPKDHLCIFNKFMALFSTSYPTFQTDVYRYHIWQYQ